MWTVELGRHMSLHEKHEVHVAFTFERMNIQKRRNPAMPMNMTEWKLVQGARSLWCFDRFMAKSSVVVDIMAAARLLIPDPEAAACLPPGRISWEVALVVGCAL